MDFTASQPVWVIFCRNQLYSITEYLAQYINTNVKICPREQKFNQNASFKSRLLDL